MSINFKEYKLMSINFKEYKLMSINFNELTSLNFMSLGRFKYDYI